MKKFFFISLFPILGFPETITVTGEEVTIKEKRPIKEEVFPSKEEISSSMVESSCVSLFDDLGETLKALPGVISPGDFCSALYIRGCYPWETIFMLDNVFIFWPYKWGGLLLFYNTDLIKRVDFYAGGYPVRGNQALGGVIDVYYKEGNKKKKKGVLEISPTTAQIMIDGPIKENTTYYFSANRTHYDLLAKWFIGEDKGYVFPYFDDFYFKLYNEPNYTDKVSLTALRVSEGMDMEVKKEEGAPDEGHFWYKYTKDILAVTQKQVFSPSLWHELTLSYLKDNLDMKFTDSPDFETKGRLKFENYTLRDEWTKEIKNHRLGFGCMLWQSVGNERWDYTWRQTEIIDGTVTKKKHTDTYTWEKTTKYWSFYLQDRIKTRFFSIEPGIRFEDNNITKEELISPRLSVLIPIGNNQFKIAFGEYSQYPMYFGDEEIAPRLKAQHSTQHIIGWEKNIGGDKRIKVEGYYNRLSKLILPDKEKEYLNKGRGRNSGIEVFLQKKEGGKLDGWLSYAYSRARREVGFSKYEYYAGTSKKEGVLYPTEQDRPHVASLVLNYKFKKRWKANIRAMYYSGNPYTPIADVKKGTENQGAIYHPIYGEYLSSRLPYYFKLDLAIVKKQKWGEWYVQFLNLTNRKNIYGYYFDDETGKMEEFQMLPFMCLGGVKFIF
ncbi:TPA: hypothetical protein DCX16_01480 [bacterium]|nr:hypothetical protein [bacterium]